MKKVVILVAFLVSLQAESYYINVMTSKHKQQLSAISYQLELLGYKRYISQNSYAYILYAGPFSSLEYAQNARANMSKNINIRNTKIVQMKSNDEKIDTQVLKQQTDKTTHFFLGLNAGVMKVNNTQDDISGSIALDSDIAENGLSVGAELGYYLNENIFMSVNYSFFSLNTFSVNNIFMTLNYEFLKEEVFSPYIGVLGGYSMLHWSEYPIASIDKDDSSTSFMSGIQMGVNIAILEDLELYGLYQLQLMDHKTNLENSQGEMQIQQNFAHNLAAGFKYKF